MSMRNWVQASEMGRRKEREGGWGRRKRESEGREKVKEGGGEGRGKEREARREKEGKKQRKKDTVMITVSLIPRTLLQC